MRKKLLSLCTMLVLVYSGFAANITWDGSESNNWENDMNWIGDAKPGAGDYAIINGGAFVVDVTTTESIQGVRVINGTLNVMLGGILTCDGATLPGIWCQGTVSNSGTISISNISHAGIQLTNGSVTNGGTLTIDGTTQAGITITSNATFTNNNMLSISGTTTHGIQLGTSNCAFANSSGGSTMIGVTGSIGGRGIFNQGGVTLSSGGTVSVDNISNAAVENAVGGSFGNSGMMTIGTNAACSHMGIRNYSSFTNGGTITIEAVSFDRLKNENGSTFANSGTLAFTTNGGEFNKSYGIGVGAADGVLTNTGTITGLGFLEGAAANLVNSGTTAPGNSPGTLTFLHGYTNTTYTAELESTTSTDQLVFANGSNDLFILGGTLNVVLFGGFMPAINDEFIIIDAPNGYSNVAGEDTFAIINYPSPAIEWEIDYNTNDVSLRYIGAVLPVELMTFTSNITRQGIDLEWKTASEINNKGFQIERSNDGESWTKLAWIDGHSTTSAINDYQYRDEAPEIGTNYYRLKQIDLTGNFSYSEVVEADWNRSAKDLRVFPNPVKNILGVSLENDEEITAIFIYDQLGRMVKRNGATTPVDLSDLSGGLYSIRVFSDLHIYTQLIVKE